MDITSGQWWLSHNHEELIQLLSDYHTLVKVEAEIDHFLSVLQCIGLDEMMRENPEVLRPLLVYTRPDH